MNDATTCHLHDMHCHLDFAPDAVELAHATSWPLASMTVDPRDFERARDAFAACANVQVAAGLHPWWIADGTCVCARPET